MARKNPFANLVDEKGLVAPPPFEYTMRGASRSILNSIDEMADRANKLVEGETVIELEPDTVDASFVQDRLAIDDTEFDELLEAIRERGQDSPILVRPHPLKSGRYMVVFGHRRLRVAALLGRKVRAVVKEMKDRDHVIAQGQENSARANLSFIEKAFFAANLARLNYDEDSATILTALSIDRATLSKMLSVTGLPADILRSIGPAKGVGRDRWYELKTLLENTANHKVVRDAIGRDEFAQLTSDERFQSLVASLKRARAPARKRQDTLSQNWAPQDGSLSAVISTEGKRFTLALKARGKDAKAFGDYLSGHLDKLYEAFRQEMKSQQTGE
jgi:ParB family chromosome partitioning protein